jgi:shikimate dehydrogenase
VKLAVIGDPVAHSASPALFEGYFAATGIAASYEAIRVAGGDGARAIADLQMKGYRGLNVTTPLKEEALAACDGIVDPEAIEIGSANVLLFQEDGVHGFNTDTTGALYVVADLIGRDDLRDGDETQGLRGTRILVLGVGPTARAAIWKFKQHGANVSVWNRTSDRADAIAERYGATRLKDGSPLDVVFSTLPPNADIDETVLAFAREARHVVDANYGPRATLAVLLDRDVIDGLAMLRHSARESFRLFSMPRTEQFRSGIEKARLVWG